jgi:hypothetical protein
VIELRNVTRSLASLHSEEEGQYFRCREAVKDSRLGHGRPTGVGKSRTRTQEGFPGNWRDPIGSTRKDPDWGDTGVKQSPDKPKTVPASKLLGEPGSQQNKIQAGAWCALDRETKTNAINRWEVVASS